MDPPTTARVIEIKYANCKEISPDAIGRSFFNGWVLSSSISLISLKKIFDYFGLIIFDVEEYDVHGGSLRLFIKHKKNTDILISKN